MLAEMYGVTRQELQDDKDLHQRLLEHAALRFQPDAIMGLYNNPEPSVILGDRMTRWPGHGLPANGSFQFVEGEYMKPEDYDAFLDDPADWAIRKYWPRVFKELEGLALLPPLGIAAYGAYSLPNLGVLTLPPVVAALQALGRAAEAQAKADVCAVQSVQRLAALGIARLRSWAQSPKRRSISCLTRCVACAASCSISTGGPNNYWQPKRRCLSSSSSTPSTGAAPPASTSASSHYTAAPMASCRCHSSRSSTGRSSRPCR